MNFELSADQRMLAETVSAFAKSSSPVSRFRRLRDDGIGWQPPIWQQMGELGWLGIPFPEECGGFGGSFVDVAIVLEGFGSTLVPEPYLASVVLGGYALMLAGDAEQHQRWLAPMVEGKTSLALAYAERSSRFDPAVVTTKATPDGVGHRVSGQKQFVLNGDAADALVVSAMTESGLGLFVIDADQKGVTRTPIGLIDGQRGAQITLDGVSCGPGRCLGTPGDAAERALGRVIDYGAAAACAEGVGVARRMLEMTVEYLKTRKQFGVHIGSFQVLQHRAVDMFIEVELLRSLAIEASIRADAADPGVRVPAISAAKAQLCAGGRRVAQEAIQLHGGIGITDEHDVGLYFKRMHALGTLFGDEAHHVARFAADPTFAEL